MSKKDKQKLSDQKGGCLLNIWSLHTDIQVKLTEMRQLKCRSIHTSASTSLIKRARNLIIPVESILKGPMCRVKYDNVVEKVYAINYGKIYVTSTVVCNIFLYYFYIIFILFLYHL